MFKTFIITMKACNLQTMNASKPSFLPFSSRTNIGNILSEKVTLNLNIFQSSVIIELFNQYHTLQTDL